LTPLPGGALTAALNKVTPAPIWDLISKALADDDMRAEAATRFRSASDLLGPKDASEGIRVSDSGRCRLELWASLHDKFDLPQDPEVLLTRFDIGTLYGAWIAALFAVSLECHAPMVRVELEPTISYRGVPGHIDALVRSRHNHDALWVVEFKSTYFSRAPEAPHERAVYQVLQAATYAKSVEAPAFSIFTIAPAVQAMYDKATKTRVTPPKHSQHDYVTADWSAAVDEEITRLKTATHNLPPQEDASEEWRHRSCRYAGCPLNPHYVDDGVLEVAF